MHIATISLLLDMHEEDNLEFRIVIYIYFIDLIKSLKNEFLKKFNFNLDLLSSH